MLRKLNKIAKIGNERSKKNGTEPIDKKQVKINNWRMKLDAFIKSIESIETKSKNVCLYLLISQSRLIRR